MNMKSPYFTLACLVVASATLIFPSSVQACRAPTPTPQEVVSGAEFVIRATATKYLKAPNGSITQLNEPGDAEIEFKVEEVLKGEPGSATIILNGYLSDSDDFNDRPVPYDFVRPGGRGGSCSAYEYKQGASFLLFLKRIDGKFTVRWYPLAPTNEQLHAANDPWLAWVRKQLESADSNDEATGQDKTSNTSDTDRVYSGGEVDKKAVIDKIRWELNHPSVEGCKGKGLVIITAVLRKSGKATNVTVREKGNCPRLEQGGRKAVENVKFKPAKKDGSPVSMYMQFEFNYDCTRGPGGYCSIR